MWGNFGICTHFSLFMKFFLSNSFSCVVRQKVPPPKFPMYSIAVYSNAIHNTALTHISYSAVCITVLY